MVYLLWSIEESREWSEKFINLHFTNCGITDCDDFIMSEVKFGVLYIHTCKYTHTYIYNIENNTIIDIRWNSHTLGSD